MASVSQLGYIGIGASDVKAWHDLATYVLGMQVIPGDQKSTSYLRMDEYHHRVELRPTGSDDLEFAGWEVPDQATLHLVASSRAPLSARAVAATNATLPSLSNVHEDSVGEQRRMPLVDTNPARRSIRSLPFHGLRLKNARDTDLPFKALSE